MLITTWWQIQSWLPRAATVVCPHPGNADALEERFQERAREWGVQVDDTLNTDSSIVAFGRCEERAVVLKVVRYPGDEWSSGQVLEAFAGRGMVRALEHVEGAVLLEQLLPGNQLADEAGSDPEATSIMASVIDQMDPGQPPANVATVESWGQGFDRYMAGSRSEIPGSLVSAAQEIYMALCASQAGTRLLHGDLHHQNVLRDSRRGWVAIDPKGVVGELAYETGAALRNPVERPDLFAAPDVIEERVNCFARKLSLDGGRILAWGFAQAVLAAIWESEDDGALKAGTAWISFAEAVLPMLERNECARFRR